MGSYKEVEGDLFQLAEMGHFHVVAHQTNCFCLQGAGISGQFALKFDTDNPDIFLLERAFTRGDINKLGQIQYLYNDLLIDKVPSIVNMYGQYRPGANTDYVALRLCLKKLNYIFKGKKIGLPQIGCGIGGGSWDEVSKIIKEELIDCDVTVVIYNKK